MSSDKIVIGIIEDNERYRQRIRDYLKSNEAVENIFSWSSAETFWRDERGKNLDILIIDIGLPEMNGVELAGLLSIKRPEIKKIILTSIESDEMIFKALGNGCLGYILKSELGDLGNTIDIIQKGGAILTPTVAFHVLKNFNKDDKTEKQAALTDRERQILEQMVCGYNVTKVADILDLSVHTVRHHVKNIHQKLDVSNRQELIRRASEMGLF